MTTKDYVQIVEYELHIAGVTIQIDRPTIVTALNESAQTLFPVMLTADDTLWTYSHAYGSSTTWAKSSFANYFRTRAVDGSAGVLPRRVSFEEFATVQYNTVEKGTASSPVFREDGANLVFSDATAGTLYALASFGEICNDTTSPINLNTDLTDAATGIIPWAFEEVFILTAIKILAERESQKPGVPESEVQKLFHVVNEAKAMLDHAYKSPQVLRETKVTPKMPPARQEQNNG